MASFAFIMTERDRKRALRQIWLWIKAPLSSGLISCYFNLLRALNKGRPFIFVGEFEEDSVE